MCLVTYVYNTIKCSTICFVLKFHPSLSVDLVNANCKNRTVVHDVFLFIECARDFRPRLKSHIAREKSDPYTLFIINKIETPSCF